MRVGTLAVSQLRKAVRWPPDPNLMSPQQKQEEEERKDEENRDHHHVFPLALGTFEFILAVCPTKLAVHSNRSSANDAVPMTRNRNLLSLFEVLGHEARLLPSREALIKYASYCWFTLSPVCLCVFSKVFLPLQLFLDGVVQTPCVQDNPHGRTVCRSIRIFLAFQILCCILSI